MTAAQRSLDRAALVIGGGSGLGAATARHLASAGYRVSVADRNGDAAAAVVAELGEPHESTWVDVTDEDSVAAMFAGRAHSLDLVVNCAGVNFLGLVSELPVGKFRKVVDICLTGSFIVIKHAADAVRSGGCIVSLTSLNARQPGIGMAAYCSAKAGLAMLIEVAALELGARSIRVNAVAPGLVETPLTAGALEVPGVSAEYLENIPLGRAGSPDDVAEAVAYVANATWMTGETIDLNGGAHLMRYPDVHGHFARWAQKADATS
ncbi:SDR family NAD(P)-dependent oxidoreductase [Nocardia miyunensis]|uniref:SDR family NAD(P)-dependent oxidoreductase n=1 Tax=Nocardia miyunensis TaxID=282684 RepID=UPI00082A8032|nr:SDR family NAD(P)-dependent oxidoreductase [Nocardia miyunensis]